MPDTSGGGVFQPAKDVVFGGAFSALGPVTSSSLGVGYETGAGGAVTQATSKSTGVTLNKLCGAITMINSALANATGVAFTLTNSLIGARDVVLVSLASAATTLTYIVSVQAVAAGSCSIQVFNWSAAPQSEALVLNFAVVKSVNS